MITGSFAPPRRPFFRESQWSARGCTQAPALRADYLATIAAAGLVDVEVLADRGFGTLVLDVVPPALRHQAEAAGVDLAAVADTVRSLTIRARKPA